MGTGLISIGLADWGFSEGEKVLELKEYYEQTLLYVSHPSYLKKLAVKLNQQGKNAESEIIKRQMAFAETIDDIKLQQVFLLTSKSLAYEYLGSIIGTFPLISSIKIKKG